MSDNDTKDSNPESQANSGGTEDLKNIKAEFSRKQTNLEAQIAELKKSLAAVNQPKPEQPQKQKKLEDIWYDNPAEAAATIEERAYSRIKNELNQQQMAQNKQQAQIATLVTEFPELQQGDSPLTQRAVEIYNSMSDEEKVSPVAYRAAVKEAALDLGVKPKSKRSQDSGDNFSLSGGTQSRPSTKQKGEIDPMTAAFAEAVGLKLDEDVKKRLASKHGRKSYNNWG